jgi:hypothetical protein
MTANADRLYSLLPSVYRRRDAEQGLQLKALLAVIEEQADILGADIDQLYEDWFVETCQQWVTPYLGDLVGYRLLAGSDEALSVGTDAARRLLAAIASRRDIANTVANRRRKGTLALLEDLARDVTGWPARAVEFRRLLGVSPAVRLYGGDVRADRRRLHRGRLADLHAGDALDRLDGPFDELAHSVDVRRVNSGRRHGRYNIPEVGLYLWRLRPYSVTGAPAHCDDRARAHFSFSILGNDTPLLTNPVAEPSPNHVADETNVPAFIRRRAFAERLAHYYGPGRSLCIYLEGEKPVEPARIVPADLSSWAYSPKRDQVAVDPVLGRIAFHPRHAPDTGVWVDYHYGFSDDIGGGEYHRPLDPIRPKTRYTVGAAPDNDFHQITAAISRWQTDKVEDPGKREAVIEITDSGDYGEQIRIQLDPGDRLTVRAAQGKRPVLRLLNWYSNRPDALPINGKESGTDDSRTDDGATDGGGKKPPLPRIVFDGLLITGRGVRVSGAVGQFVLRHCTLVPGWSLDEQCHPLHEEEASIELADTPACLAVERSILGTILVNVDEVHQEPNPIWLSDSILDAAGAGLAALTAPEDRYAHAVLNARRTTVFGDVLTHAAGLVDSSIVDGLVKVARRQAGCFRFCWLSPDSRTPRRFHCEPEQSQDPARVVPRFTSKRYGKPGYAQLAVSCPNEIRRGAEDGSEMGAFHDLFQPQREDNVRLRIDEYVPAGCDADIVIVT